jgi:hypothetical protein
MIPCFLSLATLLFILAATEPQTFANSDSVPTVSIALPADVRSETVQIRYMLSGPFGGYSSYVDSKPDLRAYEINVTRDGKRANFIRVLIYASGCRFQNFVLAFSDNQNLKEEFVCVPLSTIKLKGQIPAEVLKNQNAEVVAMYTAFWAQEFFGIKDGFVTEVQVASAEPDNNGEFEMEIPDFAADPHTSCSEPLESLGLVLRDSRTLNPIALNLEPELPEFRTETSQLRIVPAYPNDMKFVPSHEIKRQ